MHEDIDWKVRTAVHAGTVEGMSHRTVNTCLPTFQIPLCVATTCSKNKTQTRVKVVDPWRNNPLQLQICITRCSRLLWISESRESGRMGVGWLRHREGMLVKKKKNYPLCNIHSRGKLPSVQWWYKDCLSSLMPVIFWHVGSSAEILRITAGGIMVIVGLIKKRRVRMTGIEGSRSRLHLSGGVSRHNFWSPWAASSYLHYAKKKNQSHICHIVTQSSPPKKKKKKLNVKRNKRNVHIKISCLEKKKV